MDGCRLRQFLLLAKFECGRRQSSFVVYAPPWLVQVAAMRKGSHNV
jgi:hypothetical protein